MIPTISRECSQFLQESGGRCLVKSLPTKYQGFAKVKVRLKRYKTEFSENFNRAFENNTHELHHRSIFTYTNIAALSESTLLHNVEPFYVFPINGYRVLFNPTVKNSQKDYKNYDQLHISGQLVSDQLQLSYKEGSLREATEANCEVILYGIPYYYAFRASLIEDYKLFFNE